MLTGALQHIRGVGPVRLGQLSAAGVQSWHDAQNVPDAIPAGLKLRVLEESERCLKAMADDNISYFVQSFDTRDKWRILSQYFDRCSWFDIETTGLDYDDTITLIICWHRGKLHTFVEHENLDDFLDLLDEVELLVSFNGSTFDVPRILDAFHIPDLPCPHIDLRWPCYYAELNGGLKQIAAQLGLERPADLLDADGSLAVELWSQWVNSKDHAARDLLIRYCAADVLLLLPLTEHLTGRSIRSCEELWTHLPKAEATTHQVSGRETRRRELAAVFGSASPTRMRTRR